MHPTSPGCRGWKRLPTASPERSCSPQGESAASTNGAEKSEAEPAAHRPGSASGRRKQLEAIAAEDSPRTKNLVAPSKWKNRGQFGGISARIISEGIIPQ